MSQCDVERPITHPISPQVSRLAYVALGMVCLVCSLVALVVPSLVLLPMIVISCPMPFWLSRRAQRHIRESLGILQSSRWAVAGRVAAIGGLVLGAVPPVVEMVSDVRHMGTAWNNGVPHEKWTRG
jgi:uncharacterized membrane protein YesL